MNSNNKILFAILWPFGALISALKNWRQPWAMNVFWVVCTFLGAVFIFHPVDTLLGDGKDAGRYVLEVQVMHNNVQSYSEVSRNFYDGDMNDVYGPTLQYIVSRFTDNGHIFFFILAIVFGFFYSRNIWYILNRISDQNSKWMWVLIALFLLVCPISQINAYRMWTAAQIFAFGAMPFLLEGEKKKLIWCVLSIFVHHSFLFPIALMGCYFLIKNVVMKNNGVLAILLLFYLFTLTIKTLDLGALNIALQAYLPGFYDDRINGYVSESTLAARMDAAATLSWHVGVFNNIEYWINQILVLFSFIIVRKHRASVAYLIPLFAFALLIYGLSNILSCVPSGGRYITLSKMFMVPVYLLLFKEMVTDGTTSKFMNPLMFVLAFSLIFEMRKLFDSFGISVLFGNFFTTMLIDDNVPLIYFIKFLWYKEI